MTGILMFILPVGLMFIGVPIAFSMGISSVIMLLINPTASIIAIVQKSVNGLDSFTTLAIPFFMMASFILTGSGVGVKIFRFAGTLVRHHTGGLAQVNVLTSMIMAGMSGSAVSDVSGIGRMEIDAMEEAGYDLDFSAAVTAASSTIAPIIPPSTSCVLYGSITGVSIGALLIGGLFPGIVMGFLQMILCRIISKKRGYKKQPKATGREIRVAFQDSFAAMMMPVILVAGILSGCFTPTEGACVATVYSIFIGMCVYRTLNLKKLFKILMDTSVFVGSTLFVLSMASIFGLILTHNNIPATLANFFLGLSDNKFVILFLINILLLILGMLMEGNAIYMIMGPILGMLAVQLDCNPVHFGIMVVFNLTLGLITPPVGLCLFLTQKVAKISSIQMIKAALPFVIMMIICLFIITYWSGLVVWLPHAFHLC